MLCSPFCAAATTACFNASIWSCENLSFIRSWSISSTISDVLSCFAVLALSRVSFLRSMTITSFSISDSTDFAAFCTTLLKSIISLAFLIISIARRSTSVSADIFICPARSHLCVTTNLTIDESDSLYVSCCFLLRLISDIAFWTDSSIGRLSMLFAVRKSMQSLIDSE